MKIYEHPEVQLLRKIKQIRAKHPALAELAELEDEAREMVEVNALAALKKEAFNAILGPPELVGGDYENKVYAFLGNMLKYMDLEREDRFTEPADSTRQENGDSRRGN